MKKLKKRVLSLCCAATALSVGMSSKPIQACYKSTTFISAVGTAAILGGGYLIYRHINYNKEVARRRVVLFNSKVAKRIEPICNKIIDKISNSTIANNFFDSLCSCMSEEDGISLYNSTISRLDFDDEYEVSHAFESLFNARERERREALLSERLGEIPLRIEKILRSLIDQIPNERNCNDFFDSLCDCAHDEIAVTSRVNSLTPDSMKLSTLKKIYHVCAVLNGLQCGSLNRTIENEKARIAREEEQKRILEEQRRQADMNYYLQLKALNVERERNRINEKALNASLDSLRHGSSSAGYYWYNGIQYYWNGSYWQSVYVPIEYGAPAGYYEYGGGTYYWDGYRWVI